jgi:N-acetylneuraminic acid mutarotase
MGLKVKTKNVVMIGIIVISLVMSPASISLAQSGSWTTMADMPTARWALSTSAVDGKIYAFGGYATDHFLSSVEEYNPATDTWTIKKNMRREFMGFSTSTVNGKIYIIAGATSGTEDLPFVYEYDPVTDNYIRKTDMPTYRIYLSTSVVNGKIYAIGGAASVSSSGISGFYATVEEYDPSTNSWKTKTPMQEGARCALATRVVNGKIYAIGGYISDGDSVFSTVEEYDPATDTWTTKTDMPTPRGWLSTSVVDDKIYAIGGIRDYISLSTVEVYDPATDEWDTDISPMPTARCALSTSVVGGEIYAIGGQINFTGPPWDPGLKTVEKFNPLGSPISVKNIYGIQNNPTKFLLHQNYPNPFNPQTMIEYQLPQKCHVRLAIYNLLGQEIATLMDQVQPAGQFNVIWDGKDSYGRVVPSGVYFYRLETENFSEMKSMILLE